MVEKVTASKKPEAKNEISGKPRQNERSLSFTSREEQILFLQRTIGNQAVGRMILSGGTPKLSPGVTQKASPDTVMLSCDPCRSDWNTIVDADHERALTMLDTAISRLASYNGTTPADVKDALERSFKASSRAFAAWVNLNLRFLRLLAPLAGYKCQKSDCGMCNVPNRYGWSVWCVPLTDIRVCDPFYFGMSDRTRSMGLIHEWVHKYGCNFDFGYCDGSECPGGTTRSLFNADPWAKLVLDIS